MRPPNFLTVPGDVLAGYFLAAGSAAALLRPGLLALILAAVFFYAAGLLLNDWADAEVDLRERPERPIPAGLVSSRTVLIVAGLALLMALTLCATQGKAVLLVGAALGLAIVSYNLLLKNVPLLGALNMGLCRGLNLLLGATLAVGLSWPDLVGWGFAVAGGYIAAVTHLARREMMGYYGAVERWMPALVLAVLFFAYIPLSELVNWPGQVAAAVLLLIATAGAGRIACLLPNWEGCKPGSNEAPPVPTPALIGRLISLLLPLQAAMVAGSGDGMLPLLLALALVGLWPLKKHLGRKFYSS